MNLLTDDSPLFSVTYLTGCSMGRPDLNGPYMTGRSGASFITRHRLTPFMEYDMVIYESEDARNRDPADAERFDASCRALSTQALTMLTAWG